MGGRKLGFSELQFIGSEKILAEYISYVPVRQGEWKPNAEVFAKNSEDAGGSPVFS